MYEPDCLEMLTFLFDILEDADVDLEGSFHLFICGVVSLSLTKADIKPKSYSEKEVQSIANDLHDEILKTTMRFINRLKEKECI